MARRKMPDRNAPGKARDTSHPILPTRHADGANAGEGKPVSAQAPMRRSATVLDKYREHPWVRNQHFYTLPSRLWELVLHDTDREAFDSGNLTMELELSELSGDHSASVGFWDGQRISFEFLRRSELRVPALADIQALGWEIDVARFAANMNELDRHSKRFFDPLQSYLGWLMSDPTFLNEHDAFLEKWSSYVAHGEIGRSPFLLDFGTGAAREFNQSQLTDDDRADPQTAGFLSEYEDFCRRWRLIRLAGPWLPVPRRPMLLGEMAASVVPQLVREGGLFWIPDTIPIPSRDELRNILDSALHGGEQPSHLQPWKEIIASDNAARKELTRFRRVFEVQHYWRNLKRRHAKSMKRREGKIKQALASYLDVSVDCVHRDLLFLNNQLGRDWTSRFSASTRIGV